MTEPKPSTAKCPADTEVKPAWSKQLPFSIKKYTLIWQELATAEKLSFISACLLLPVFMYKFFGAFGLLVAVLMLLKRTFFKALLVPILLIALLSRVPMAVPYLLSLFILLVVAYQILLHLPQKWRKYLQAKASKLGLEDKRLDKHTEDGIRQMRPFILGGLFLVPPVALLMMLAHAISGIFQIKGKAKNANPAPDSNEERLVFKQCLSKEKDTRDANFFLSPAFAGTLVAIFVSGIPAAFVLLLYKTLGIDAMLGFPSQDPKFIVTFCIIGIYITGLSWCLCTLFFRAWFTFPLNFMSTEYVIEFSESGVYKSGIKGWFMELLLFTWPEFVPARISWDEIASLEYSQGGIGRLSPLPDKLFAKTSLIYKSLNRLAEFTDAVLDQMGRTEYLTLKSDWNKSLRIDLKLRLWELDANDRARFYYALRRWAPLLRIDPRAQEALVGSCGMQEARYTQIWFDLLSCRDKRKREGELETGDQVGNAKYEIYERLDAGGQANVYLAKNADGQKLVLKEFILANENESLLESARDFETESAILHMIHHPLIVRMIDMFAEDRRIYLVLEKIEGKDLRKLVQETGALEESKVVGLALQMCEILSYLHGQEPPVIHRDFTPDNLILKEDGKIVLIDFSTASHKTSYSGDCVGKHAYTSPDQFRGQACPQSDIYALGATLYYLLVGQDPVPLSESHPKTKVPGLSQDLDGIIAHATKLKLAERYENVDWLKLDLEALQKSD